MKIILDVPSTSKVNHEPEVITISDDEEQATTHVTLSLEDRKDFILKKFDLINDQLNSNWPNSFEDFRKVFVIYKGRCEERFKNPTRISEEEKMGTTENHWFLDLSLLGHWINIMKIQEQVEELLKPIEDANDLQTENGKILVLFVPSFPWQNKIMAAMESCEFPLIDKDDENDENLFNSEHWKKVKSNRKLVLQKVSEFANHVIENKETKPPIKFKIKRINSEQCLNCYYAFYENSELVKKKFDRLPAAPPDVTINPQIVDGKTEIKWNHEVADQNSFLVRYRTLSKVDWTERKISKPVITLRPGPAKEFCVAVDTCFGHSKFSPVIEVPELLQQAEPILKKLSHNTAKVVPAVPSLMDKK